MIKKIFRYLRTYKKLAVTVLAIAAALPLDIAGYDSASQIILAATSIGIAIPLVWGMIQDLRTGTYGVDILAATAIITSVILGEYWAGIIIVLMLTGGESLEDYAEARARRELDALLSGAPKMAHVVRGRKTLDIKASEVKAGDKVIIRAGELVPVDAVIIEGSASFDESSLTGESVPASKKKNDELLSGSINMDGAVTAKALRAAKDSQYEQIIQLVKSAASSKSPFVRLADRYSVPFTIIAFAIAISAWVISGESIRFLEVLVVATPCPLILAAPIAIISGMSRGAKRGIIFKNGGALERLGDVKTMAFDKTGTLTKGQLKVTRVMAAKGFTKEDVISLAASAEQNSNHLLAKAIVEEAARKKLRLAKAKQVRESSGKGLVAVLGKYQVLVGNKSLLQEHNVIFPLKLDDLTVDKTSLFVSLDGELAGIISFSDEIRPEAKRTLKHLKQMGINNLLMVTGDNKAAAQHIAKQLGISEVKAEALPADKLKLVEDLKDRPVGFVGDGVNDAPVLAASDVGVALGARGSAAASESADVVIMVDDVERVAVGAAIAKKTLFIARQSILIGIFISVGLMFIFSTGRFTPVVGAFLQEVVDVIVIFNALRAHGGPKNG